jgi:hypothetical protein
LEEGQAFLAVVGFGPKGKISAALFFKPPSPPPLLKYTYVTDAILLFLSVGVGPLCRVNLQTDSTQLFPLDPIPAKAKNLLLSVYKFSLLLIQANRDGFESQINAFHVL